MTAPLRGSASGRTRQQLCDKRYERRSRNLYVMRDAELDLRARVEAVR